MVDAEHTRPWGQRQDVQRVTGYAPNHLAPFLPLSKGERFHALTSGLRDLRAYVRYALQRLTQAVTRRGHMLHAVLGITHS